MATPNGWFDRTMVERTIKYFSNPDIDEKDAKKMKDLVGDFVKFEEVVERGLVAPDAKQLAKDFVVFGQDWIKKNKLDKVYADLKK
ncbi:MAG: hypothetical protein JNM17_30200 [Archangium sp.]|nr:hypothetical protein [Archangium sp.]